MKVNITLDDKLMERIDNYADENYMSRSGFVSLACANYLNSMDVLAMVKDISKAMNRIAETGELDKGTMKILQEYEDACNLVLGRK